MASANTLLTLNYLQRPGIHYQRGAVELEEFTKLVYDSKFTKRTGEMSFVNSESDAFSGQREPDWGQWEIPRKP